MNRLFRLLQVLVLALIAAGCGTPSGGNGGGRIDDGVVISNKFQIGDTVIVRFSGAGAPEDHQENIKSDGTITLQNVGSVQAKGKSPRELQTELQARFDELFRNLTVTVEAVQYIYVSGDVNSPGTFNYSNNMTLLKAIATAGDFNNFARKSRVQVTRASGGEPIYVNANDALNDARLDIPIYPGDQIFVPRRIFFE